MFDSTRRSSKRRNGSSIGTDPVAMITARPCHDVTLAIGRPHLDHVAWLERAAALRPRDLVLAEQELHALGVLRYDFGLARHHGAEVDARVVHRDAMFGSVQPQPLEVFRRLQQRLRRNAADIHARAAKGRIGFDAGDGEAQLGRANACHIAAWPAAKHQHISMIGSHRGNLIPDRSITTHQSVAIRVADRGPDAKTWPSRSRRSQWPSRRSPRTRASTSSCAGRPETGSRASSTSATMVRAAPSSSSSRCRVVGADAEPWSAFRRQRAMRLQQ